MDTTPYRDVFLTEAEEHVASMNKSLLDLEKRPGRLKPAGAIFREIHTLKSMSATMNYERTARLCHAMEDVLDAIRKKRIKLERCAGILFECFDTLESSLKEISENREELDTSLLTERLRTLSETDEGQTVDDQAAASAEQSVMSAAAKVQLPRYQYSQCRMMI